MFNRLKSCLLILTAVCMAGCAGEPVDLLTGAIVQYSVDGGETFSVAPPMIAAQSQVEVIVKAEFDVATPADFASLDLSHSRTPWDEFDFALNGNEIGRPIEGMVYRRTPGIDAAFLAEGANALVGTIGALNEHDDARAFEVALSLKAMRAEDLAFQTGPVLGAYNDGYFTVTCRTNIPADVTLRMAGGAWETVSSSPRGLLHRFSVPRPADRPLRYRLEASRDGVTRKTPWYDVDLWTPAGDRPLRLMVMGDSRTLIEPWRQVAASAIEASPDIIVFVGDMVADGRNDWEWDEQFIGPSADLFRTIPMYPVIGNHENDAPLYYELFHSPTPDGRGPNWRQMIGDVLLIGIHGEQSFAADTDNYKWLEKTLAESDAKFIFCFNHFPAWSSYHRTSGVDELGRPYEETTYRARTFVLPLLAKYGATAFIAGHDHFYERSEPPSGVTCVVTGGAGAPLYGKSDTPETDNPHSVAFAQELHYCLLEISGDTCTMQVVTPEGETIDTRTWQAREPR